MHIIQLRYWLDSDCYFRQEFRLHLCKLLLHKNHQLALIKKFLHALNLLILKRGVVSYDFRASLILAQVVSSFYIFSGTISTAKIWGSFLVLLSQLLQLCCLAGLHQVFLLNFFEQGLLVLDLRLA